MLAETLSVRVTVELSESERVSVGDGLTELVADSEAVKVPVPDPDTENESVVGRNERLMLIVADVREAVAVAELLLVRVINDGLRVTDTVTDTVALWLSERGPDALGVRDEDSLLLGLPSERDSDTDADGEGVELREPATAGMGTTSRHSSPAKPGKHSHQGVGVPMPLHSPWLLQDSWVSLSKAGHAYSQVVPHVFSRQRQEPPNMVHDALLSHGQATLHIEVVFSAAKHTQPKKL
jgi:hypothetical protein